MWRLSAIAVSLAMLFSLAHTVEPSRAQTAAVPAAVFADMKASIMRAIGAQDRTVEISVAGNILTVLRLNSNMNESAHGARDNEARAIFSVVSKAISGKSQFSKLHTIRVQYAARPTSAANTRIIDTVDFRKDAQGLFQFHRT
jgi:hypothetical protein